MLIPFHSVYHCSSIGHECITAVCNVLQYQDDFKLWNVDIKGNFTIRINKVYLE